MKFWVVKKGNKSVRDILIKDKDGNIVTNLSNAEEIIFQVKKEKTDVVIKIEKTLDDGIEVDTPSEGYLRITLKPTDTEINVGNYFMALQIKWNEIDVYEIKITIDNKEAEHFSIKQDIINY